MSVSAVSSNRPHISERVGRVASPAIGAKLAIMNIIRPVAIRTAVTQAELLLQRSAVARIAGNLDMGAKQRERGLHVVFEAPGRPVDRVVADATVIPEIPAMRVVVVMTSHTVGRRIFEHFRYMACIALFLIM